MPSEGENRLITRVGPVDAADDKMIKFETTLKGSEYVLEKV